MFFYKKITFKIILSLSPFYLNLNLQNMFNQLYKKHYKETLKVAYPVVLGQAGHMMATIADSVMIGNISSTQLAACSFANSVFMLIFILSIGITIGLTPLVGKANGSLDTPQLNKLFINGIVVNLSLGLFTNILLLLVIPLFKYLGQDPEVVRLATPYYLYITFSIIPYMLFMSAKSFADGLEITKPGMLVSIIANSTNVVLNFVFIYGLFGAPRMEIDGAGLATLISRITMPFLIFGIYYYRSDLKTYLYSLKSKLFDKKTMIEYLKIGVPIGVQSVLEMGAFVVGSLIVGSFGAREFAAHHIALNLASLTFLMAQGVASAATIRVSNLIGQKDYKNMRVASYSSFILSTAFMCFTALTFIFFGKHFAALYSNDILVINIASQLLVIAGLFQLVDGIQSNSLGNLRGFEDVKIPTIITTFSYWLITIPLCFYLAKNAGMKEQGVWWGYCIGLLIAASILYIRFEIVSRRQKILLS